MHHLNILDRLHARLLDIIGTALPLITSSIADADLIGLAHLRTEMIQAIDAYTHYVHDHVLDAAVAANDPARMQLAHEIKIGCISLEQTYRTFTSRWAHRDGMLNWPEYRLSAIVMMKQIRDQVRSASRWEPLDDRATGVANLPG
ncbi:hypothetical protein [Sphingomonas sp.]|uniref:hypothetical protein n=1 Tax=Sphingomonas sp. TaxID=28214 RepID=UPI0035BC8EE2